MSPATSDAIVLLPAPLGPSSASVPPGASVEVDAVQRRPVGAPDSA